MLKYHPSPLIRAYIVWERILATDYATPGTAVLARVADPRAAQFWDDGLLLSAAAQPVLTANLAQVTGKTSLVTGKAVWDFVAIYAPGVTWGDAFPLPRFGGGPVADVTRQISDQLPL